MIQWAPAQLQSDTDAVLLAVQSGRGPQVFQHVPRHFRTNKRVALAAVEANGQSIHSIDDHFYDDEDVILAACWDYPALPLASPRLQRQDVLVRNICMRCIDTMIGPNLMPFLEHTPMLQHISTWLPNATILCRIRLLSGRAVLTSFSTLYFRRRDWHRDFLGLHVLFSDDDAAILGHTICNGVITPHIQWRAVRSEWHRFGLRLQELNEVSFVRECVR